MIHLIVGNTGSGKTTYSKETRLKRIMKRNNEKGETFEFEVSLEDFNFMENWFEKPDQIEMKDGLRITE